MVPRVDRIHVSINSDQLSPGSQKRDAFHKPAVKKPGPSFRGERPGATGEACGVPRGADSVIREPQSASGRPKVSSPYERDSTGLVLMA